MGEKHKTCDQLLLLVGSNPLPNYLTALVLRPASIRLFYSPETERVKNKLGERLKAKFPKLFLCETCIEDATDAAKVRGALHSNADCAHLNYTGGTKIMAAHARMAFRDEDGKDDHASYLDERKGVLRFDDGYEIDLSEQRLELSMEDILGLHGIERMPKVEQSTPHPTGQDAENITKAVLKDPELAQKLYQIHREKEKRLSFEKAKQNPVSLGELVNLSISRLPEKDWTTKTYEKWCDFLGGKWLEVWYGALVRDIAEGDEIAVGADCKLANGRSFEIDLAVVRGHRLYVISCTTHTKIGLCKSKLFEVALRARQLGGDLARSALVCLLHGSDSKGPYVDQLRNDVVDVWSAPNTPRVFGLDDLREWAGTDGRPNRDSFQKWFDS
jgi:hypothetical protein